MEKEHLRIEISKLKANPKNPKKHDDELIKGSIKELGFVDDIVVDENNIILAGHGRVKALKDLGAKDTEEVDVIKISGWTQEQKDKYLLLSNKSVEKGGWDFDMLAKFDRELLEMTGFEEDDFNLLSMDQLNDSFSLPNGGRSNFEQITFTLDKGQMEKVMECLKLSKKDEQYNNFDNENSNGNAIFLICEQWEKLKK